MPASSYLTATGRPLAVSSDTTKRNVASPVSPSVTLGSDTEITGRASLSRIVPAPVMEVAESRKIAFEGLLSETTTVSRFSFSVSPVTDTLTSLLVSPGLKVNVPAFKVA